jgi:dolichol-phosphate mannosyltransferase
LPPIGQPRMTDEAPRGGDVLELSIVIPTYCERGSVGELVARLRQCLAGLHWEAVFVDDDSPDGTADLLRSIARRDPRVRCLQRVGRRGLASACIEGMLSCAADCIAVMDADLQHDETRLLEMRALIRKGEADLVIATRYAAAGDLGDLAESRVALSRFATRLSRYVSKHAVSDPMSGFFMLRRSVMEANLRGLSAVGFKILLDILATADRSLVVREVPYSFRSRFAGESKLDSMVMWEYGMLLADKLVGRYIPVRLLSFALVGAVGAVVHLLAIAVLPHATAANFALSQTLATTLAMTSNFTLNNLLTYRDRRLRGRLWLRGWLVFCAACSVGAIANVGVAGFLYGGQKGWLLSALAGIVVGTMWNYTVSAMFAWRTQR